jgi:phosphoesterase RecJ-like protein
VSSRWPEALALLEGAQEVALACHVGPDGDALGSMLGLGLALRSRGARVTASFGSEPFEVPSPYRGLPGLDLLVPSDDVPASPALLVTFDTGSVDRLGSLADRVESAREVLVVDHHASNTRFGTLNLVEESAASTASIVVELLDALGATLSRDVAACVYTGLATDTGSFKYRSTTPEVHRLAARLLETGLRHDLINREIWDTASFGYVKALGLACARAVLEPDAAGGLGMVWTAVGAEDLHRYDLVLADVEGVIDVLRMTAEAEVAVVVKTDPEDGLLKVSTRSKGALDVGAVCVSLGGGGHRFAAGFTSHEPLATTMERLRTALADAAHLEQ